MKQALMMNPEVHFDLNYATHVIAVAMAVKFKNIIFGNPTSFMSQDGVRVNTSMKLRGVVMEHDEQCAFCGAPIPKGKLGEKKDLQSSFTDTPYMHSHGEYICMPCAFFVKKDGLTRVQSTGGGMFGALYIADEDGKHTNMKAMTHTEALKILKEPTLLKGLPFVFLVRIYGWEASQGMQRHTAWKATVNHNPDRYYLQLKSKRLLYDKNVQSQIESIVGDDEGLLKLLANEMKHFDRLSNISDAELREKAGKLFDYTGSDIAIAGMVADCKLKAIEVKKKAAKANKKGEVQ